MNTEYHNMAQNVYYRQAKLAQLSEMIIDGNIVIKYDHIGTINYNNHRKLNVYRRYNSLFSIIIEDECLNYYVQPDLSIRQSLGNALYLSHEDVHQLHSSKCLSIQHGVDVNSMSIMELTWSQIQELYSSIIIDVYIPHINYLSQADNIEYEDIQAPIPDREEQKQEYPIPQSPVANKVVREDNDGNEAPAQTPLFREAKKRRTREVSPITDYSDTYNFRNKKQRT